MKVMIIITGKDFILPEVLNVLTEEEMLNNAEESKDKIYEGFIKDEVLPKVKEKNVYIDDNFATEHKILYIKVED